MIKNENTYVVHGWMINDYKLSGNELLTYAIIFGFSQEENNTFVCSLDYLASWLCCSKKTAEKALFGLKSKGLIEQVVVGNNKYKKSEYVALRPLNSTVVDSTIVKNTTVTMEEITTANTNNINNNKEIIKEKLNQNCELITNDSILSNYNGNTNIKNKTAVEQKRETFRKPTIEEINNYCIERNNDINAEYWYDYYESKGWMIGKTKMKDWKAAVRTWEQNNKKKNNINVTLDDVKEIRTTNEIFE